MATTLSYTVSAYVPFTKILSANINQDKTDIQNRINWAGGTSATTGLGDDNIQSIAASGGGLTRATKLKAGTVKAFIVNDSSTGAMSELVAGTSKVIVTDSSGIPASLSQLTTTLGGTGINVDPTAQSAGDVIQINAGSTAFTVGAPTSVPASLKLFQFFNLS